MTDILTYLTPAEVAERIGVSVDFVENLCKGKAPELGHNRFGRSIRIPEDALTDYLARTFVPASAEVASLDSHRRKRAA